MEEVKKQDVTQVTEPKEKPENYKEYDYAHLVLYCGKCRSKYILDENVKKGTAVQIVLPPTNVHEMRLVCKDCKNEMALFYIESNKKDDVETKTEVTATIKETDKEGDTNEPVSEESITEATIV